MTLDEITAQTLLWTKIAAIGQVAGALATAAAVVISLWVVLSERRVRLKVEIGIRVIIGGDPLDVVSFSIANVGQRTVVINSVGWRTGWGLPGILLRFNDSLPAWMQQQWALQIPSNNLASHRLPATLEPGNSIVVFVEVEHFLKDEEKRESFFRRKLPWRKVSTAARIFGMIHVVGSTPIGVLVEPSLRKFLSSGEYGRTAQRINQAKKKNGR